VKLGTISLWGDDLEAFRREIRMADELGCEVITIGDTPFAWHELYVSLAVAAVEAPGRTFAPMVTVPVLRHPVATASAMCSIDELTGGQTVIAIGTGASVTGGLGKGAMTQAEIREHLLALKALLNGESITWDGTRTKPLRLARAVPVYLSAYGPRALGLAGAVADGVVLSIGSSLDRVDESIAVLRHAEREADRAEGEVDVWAFSFVSIRDAREQALDEIMPFLASGVQRMRFKHFADRVPDELRPAMAELRRQYDESEHVIVGGNNARLTKELGLADFFADETAVVGTPREVAEIIEQLSKRLSCFICSLPGNADPEGTLRRFVAAAR
jgi:alkanesulfonate monooxygenase SsuD/methylene tetrahydromethanopterin reductase-like flavin-dependent oxidoreductase (luciferase family)